MHLKTNGGKRTKISPFYFKCLNKWKVSSVSHHIMSRGRDALMQEMNIDPLRPLLKELWFIKSIKDRSYCSLTAGNRKCTHIRTDQEVRKPCHPSPGACVSLCDLYKGCDVWPTAKVGCPPPPPAKPPRPTQLSGHCISFWSLGLQNYKTRTLILNSFWTHILLGFVFLNILLKTERFLTVQWSESCPDRGKSGLTKCVCVKVTFIVFRLTHTHTRTHTSGLTSTESCIRVWLQCLQFTCVSPHLVFNCRSSRRFTQTRVCLLTASLSLLGILVSVTIVTTQRSLTLASS